MITFYKTMEDKSIRYYSIHDRQSHLFSRYSFITIFGIDQGIGRERIYTFSSIYEMDAKLKELCKERREKGYKVLYSFSKKEKYKNIFNEARQRHA